MGVSDRMLLICCYGSFILQYQRRVPLVVQLHQQYFKSCTLEAPGSNGVCLLCVPLGKQTTVKAFIFPEVLLSLFAFNWGIHSAVFFFFFCRCHVISL